MPISALIILVWVWVENLCFNKKTAAGNCAGAYMMEFKNVW